MALLEKYLAVRTSMISGAGKGLFTKKMIPKGTRIVEYKGKVSTWKNADHMEGLNAYIYYVNRNHVIDSSTNKNLARYVNDAKGLTKIKAITNNCKFVQDDNLRVFIEAKKDIPANAELLVGYGKSYWDVIIKNNKEQQKVKTSAKKEQNNLPQYTTADL